MTPASESLVALTITMNRIVVPPVSGLALLSTSNEGRRNRHAQTKGRASFWMRILPGVQSAPRARRPGRPRHGRRPRNRPADRPRAGRRRNAGRGGGAERGSGRGDGPGDRRPCGDRGRQQAGGRRGDGGDGRARAGPDRPAREQRRRRPLAARCRGRRTRRTGGTCSRSTCSAPTSAPARCCAAWSSAVAAGS